MKNYWAAEDSSVRGRSLAEAVYSYIKKEYTILGIPIPDIDVTFYEYGPDGQPTGTLAGCWLVDWALAEVRR